MPAITSRSQRLCRPRSGHRVAPLLAAGAVAMAALAVVPAQAHAQDGRSLRPPAPAQPADPPVIRNFLIAGVVLVSMVAATVIPAKRGHQD